jgi:hypothetical protein
MATTTIHRCAQPTCPAGGREFSVTASEYDRRTIGALPPRFLRGSFATTEACLPVLAASALDDACLLGYACLVTHLIQ